jgi:hypothetical protein
LFADSIRASSLNRLHQQAGQKTAPDQCHCVNLPLATREPSTEDIVSQTGHVRKVPNAEQLTGRKCLQDSPRKRTQKWISVFLIPEMTLSKDSLSR